MFITILNKEDNIIFEGDCEEILDLCEWNEDLEYTLSELEGSKLGSIIYFVNNEEYTIIKTSQTV